MRPYTVKKKRGKNKTSKKRMNITCGHPLIEVVRNNMTESLHAGHLLILNEKGQIQLSLGKHDFLIYPRSAIKAIQASAMVRHGLDIPDDLLALVSSSHIGTSLHQQKVQEILATVGLDQSILQNTPFLPMYTERSVNGLPTSLAAPCSGKHAGMIVTSKLNNWSLKTYKSPRHPMQVACKKELELLSGEKITKIAVDGCGVPLFAITLRGLARAIHNLMRSADPVHQRVVKACKKHPEMVSGEGTLPTVAMQQVNDLYVKNGAESVLVAGLSNGSTIVWKVSDGSERGANELLSAALKKIGINYKFSTNNDPHVLIRVAPPLG
jgi:L-asparaginase II